MMFIKTYNFVVLLSLNRHQQKLRDDNICEIATDHSTQGMNIHLSSYKRKADSGTESNHDGSILAKDQKTSTQRIMYRWA